MKGHAEKMRGTLLSIGAQIRWANWPMSVLKLYHNACTSHESSRPDIVRTVKKKKSSSCHEVEQSVWQKVGETDKLSQMHCGFIYNFLVLGTKPEDAS